MARPVFVSGLAPVFPLTVTWSHLPETVPAGHVSAKRSEPLMPLPANAVTVGAVARVDHPAPGVAPVPGVLLLPTLNSKSAAVIFAGFGSPLMSMKIPLKPLPKLDTFE